MALKWSQQPKHLRWTEIGAGLATAIAMLVPVGAGSTPVFLHVVIAALIGGGIGRLAAYLSDR